MNAFQKTEAMLWNYNSYKLAVELEPDNKIAQKLVHNIDTAIFNTKSKYIELIPMQKYTILALLPLITKRRSSLKSSRLSCVRMRL